MRNDAVATGKLQACRPVRVRKGPLLRCFTYLQSEYQVSIAMQVSNAIYFVVVTVCAPVWEEAIFRGFLLPSLTRYMPLTAAIAVSALSFAGAHFSLQRFLPLVLLGVIFGTLLVRTRNLLPCVLLHSLWNAYIFWQLTCRGTVVM